MVTTITQRISLEGSDDIKRKLEELGRAGQQAFKQIQDAASKPITDPAQFDRTRQALADIAAAARQAGDAIEKTGEQAQVAGDKAGAAWQSAAVKFGIAAAGIVLAISAITRSLLSGAGETAQTISDQADRLGLTVEQWTALRRAIDAAGNSSEEFANSVTPLMVNLNRLFAESGTSFQTFADGATVAIHSTGKLSEQSKQLVQVLEKFGVRRDIIDRGSVAIMDELARIIDGMPEGTAKAAAGLQFFGAKWRDVVASLTVGAKAVGDAQTELDNKRRASRELDPQEQAAAKEAKNNWEDLGKAITAVKDKIGAFLAPSSAARAKWLTDMVDQARTLLTTFMSLDEAGRKGFLQNLGDSAGATAFRVLIALGEQLAGLWRDVLVPAGKSLFGVFDSIAGVFEGITGSQIAAFFITAAIAVGGFVLALKTLSLLLTPLTLLFSPFGAALAAAAVAAALFWDKIAAGAQEAAALIPAELQAIADSFNKLFAGDFSGFWDQFSSAAVAALDKIRQNAADTNWVKIILDTLAQVPEVIRAIVISIGALIKVLDVAAGGINAVFGTNLSGTGLAMILLIGQMTGGLQALAAVASVAGAAITTLGVTFGILATIIGGIPAAIVAISVALAAAGAAWLVFSDSGQAAIKAIGASIDWLWNKIKGIGSAIAGIGGGGTPGETTPAPEAGGQRFARGGMIAGRGSGTSDSNLAWVSRGEHIMPARAVAQPGVLAFLEALRRSGGNLRDVLDGISRYAAGGLVRMPQVGGGNFVGMSHVTIQFPGLAPISGLRASAAVVDDLRKAAALAQVRSGGRKPSRYT